MSPFNDFYFDEDVYIDKTAGKKSSSNAQHKFKDNIIKQKTPKH
jgi:hypothetical protein